MRQWRGRSPRGSSMETGLIWSALFSALAGAAIAWVCAPRVIDMLLQTVGPVSNYRGRPVAFPVGLALILGAAAGTVGALAASPLAWTRPLWAGHAACLILTLGFGFAGFVDDVLGGRDHSGFRGHLGAMHRGIVTTGAFKIAMGAILSLAAVMVTRGETWISTAPTGRVNLLLLAQLVLDSALVAVSANLINLLDRRPGRAAKGFLLGVLAVALGIWLSRGANELLRAVSLGAGTFGAAVALIWLDLGERVMLGDTGSNPLGAVLGLMLLRLAPGLRIVLFALVAWLTLASERISFSDVIDSNRILRFLDRLGRKDL